jgi:magnesium-transporting ATPase (P-type)
MRVLALAMRPMPAKAKLEHVLRVQGAPEAAAAAAAGGSRTRARCAVESELNFVGFVAFECKVRADSAAVIAALGDAAIRVAMVTGDAPLTALSVARDCKFLHGTQPALILQKDGKSWRGALRKDEALEIAADWRAPDAGLGALKAGWRRPRRTCPNPRTCRRRATTCW